MKTAYLVFVALVTFGSTSCGTAQKSQQLPEERAIAEIVQGIRNETGVENGLKTIWKTIEAKDLFNDGTDRDKIIRYSLRWCLQFLEDAESSLTKGDMKKTREEVQNARNNFTEAVELLHARKVNYHPQVKKLYSEYWQVRKRLEDYDKRGIKTFREKEYQRAKELHELYFTAAAVSNHYGRLEETITYLEEAVKNARAAEIVFDREWSKKLEQTK